MDRHTLPGRAPDPTWPTIPQRGLYTGLMILGAVGAGKTSACMYPYVDQSVRWRSDDPGRAALTRHAVEPEHRQVRDVPAVCPSGRDSTVHDHDDHHDHPEYRRHHRWPHALYYAFVTTAAASLDGPAT